MNTRRPKPQSADSLDVEQPPRLFASLRQLLITVLGMAHTRMALAGVELEEELQRLIGLLLSMLGLLVFGLVGVLMFTLRRVNAGFAEMPRIGPYHFPKIALDPRNAH